MKEIRDFDVALYEKVKGQHSFLHAEDIRVIRDIVPKASVLVRCGQGRFTCTIDNVEHFIGIIERHGDMVRSLTGVVVCTAGVDYVRDVSLLNFS